MDVDVQNTDAGQSNILDTVEGEIHFFRAIMRARPVGMHRYFHVIAMQNAIEKGTKTLVPIEDIWRKLESCYNLEALEALEAEYEANGSSNSTPQPPSSPTATDNLATHPFFRDEFSLPSDFLIEQEIARRRVRTSGLSTSPSVHGTPEPLRTSKRGRKRKPSKADMAGLVSGDSDSSDLTQEESLEGDAAESERRATSVVTGTDGGTEDLQDEEVEDADQDTNKRPRKSGRKPGATGRTRTTSAARTQRKRKR